MSKWGQIKIQDTQPSEARNTITKFCSDPICALPEDYRLKSRNAQTVNCGDVGSFAAKSYENTRGLRHQRATALAARLSPDFHQNHTTSPLAVLVGDQFLA